jgi:hypothetical protein
MLKRKTHVQNANHRLGKMSYRMMEDDEQKLRRESSGKTDRWRDLVVGFSCIKWNHL